MSLVLVTGVDIPATDNILLGPPACVTDGLVWTNGDRNMSGLAQCSGAGSDAGVGEIAVMRVGTCGACPGLGLLGGVGKKSSESKKYTINIIQSNATIRTID